MYRRNLPHWHPAGRPLFITWRLAGTYPKKHRSGPAWLWRPEIAGCVLDCLREHAGSRYELHAFVVMPDHVHVLLTPSAEPSVITGAIKGKSSRIANTILQRTGSPFWQDESFDHWIRSRAEFEETRSYIEANPVRAGLVSAPEEWPYSSAAVRSFTG
ncbi:MAG TPA: transposase [Bryobacteraceae bacterium]|nr:transposase [Bryobacteraceae bacterium]